MVREISCIVATGSGTAVVNRLPPVVLGNMLLKTIVGVHAASSAGFADGPPSPLTGTALSRDEPASALGLVPPSWFWPPPPGEPPLPAGPRSLPATPEPPVPKEPPLSPLLLPEVPPRPVLVPIDAPA